MTNLNHINPQQIDNSIEQLLARFMLGSDNPLTLQDCPNLWHASLIKQDSQELPLVTLALLSQYQAIMQPAQTANLLTQLPQIPTLDLPILPCHIGKHVENILSENKDFFYPLLALCVERGYTIAPTLWLQYHNEKPVNLQYQIKLNYRVYKAWHLWYERHQQLLQNADNLIHRENETLTIDTWGDFLPTERLLMLHELRQKNPDECREIIAHCLAQERVDKRLKIIEVLKINLSENDLSFLQQLQQDRSSKVQAIANQLLARLGQTVDNSDEELQELINMLEVKPQSALKNTSAKLWGKKQLPEYLIFPKKLSSSVKELQRLTLLIRVNIVRLAQGLSLSVEQLLMGWVFDKFRETEIRVFISHIANLPDNYLPVVYNLLLSEPKILQIGNTPDLDSGIQRLWQRFSDEQRQNILLQIIKSPEEIIPIPVLLYFCAKPFSEQSISWEEFKRSYLWNSQVVNLTTSSEIDSSSLKNILILGLLLPTSLVEKLLDYFLEKVGFTNIFTTLLLNVELKKLTTPN